MTTEGRTGFFLGRRPGEQPIGYWLKRLDGAIEAAFAATLAIEGLARRHWQTMNILRNGSGDVPALAERLRPFWGEGAITLEEVLNDLQHRALVVNDEGLYSLTAEGRAMWATIAEKVTVARNQLVNGVTPEEYLATVQVLQRMTANLEGACE